MKMLLNLSTVALIAAGSVYLYAHEEGEVHHRNAAPAIPVTKQEQAAAALYRNECGSCHMAYQPSFLSGASWKKTMNTLENHFGTDATLDPADHQTIQDYLVSHASPVRTVDKKGTVALRISETPHFIHEHGKIPQKLIMQPEVKSFANCTACHPNAAGGSYREREIAIPNYGRWED